ncbi:hypothetical protein QBC35DRAFT_418305 [Podospora australis]|uniref:Uncharacterized protein n=1 Tax=Podospora australis TaxID=1536484 RepID=A0AAN6WL01_9PEZI|nr:hypothetical protein QBC35DRAFT_418305 [Podospora australis]
MADLKDMEAQMQQDAITQIANVSTLLRQAIQAQIPTAPEQYMSIAIPGTTIDVRDVTEGGTFVYGKEYSAFPPISTRQAESRLVDNMCPLSFVMVGNTGKSVSRSYSRALDGLVPKKASVTSGGINPIRSPGERGYDNAMEYLTKIDEATGMTPIDVYVEKQTAWAEAQDAWDKAKIKAQKDAYALHKTDVVLQRQAYDEWNQANYRKFKFAVQGRWMDWVSNGHKYDVEFNFGMVDIDSIMARVENSKESMRNSTFVDADGANEVLLVNLTPKNWATLCKQKQEGWFKRNGQYSLEQLDAEIQRLTRLLASYETLQAVTTPGGTGANGGAPAKALEPAFPIANPSEVAPTKSLVDSDADLAQAFKTLYIKEAAFNNQSVKLASLSEAAREKAKQDKPFTDAATELDNARTALHDAIKANKNVHAAWAKYNVATMQGDAKVSMDKWLQGTIKTINGQLDALRAKRVEKAGQQPVKVAAILDASNEKGKSGTTVAADGSELANPMFGVPNPSAPTATSATATIPSTPAAAGSESDPWVTISASFKAEDQRSSAKSSSWGMSVGGGAGWGLWSVGGSYAHEEAKSDSQSDMASCDVSITFDALVVNIQRPWLYAELFNDFELDVADDIMLSPGASELHRMMKAQVAASKLADEVNAAKSVVDELAQYNSFPAFPTSFILAANTIIDFKGNTQHIEDHFSSSSSSGSTSVGWGPFSVSSSFHSSSQEQTHQMQSTATGCRLTFGAPQIIGWVNQILPALPRKSTFEPMVQNNVVRKQKA